MSVSTLRQKLTGNSDVTVKLFPRADHQIAVADTGGRNLFCQLLQSGKRVGVRGVFAPPVTG